MAQRGETTATRPAADEAAAPPAHAADHQRAQRLGEKLISLGLLTQDQLDVALREQENTNQMLGGILVDMGFLDDATLNDILADTAGVERFDPSSTLIDPEAVRLIPKEVAMKHRLLPFSADDNAIMVAMADTNDIVALDVLRRHTDPNLTIRPWMATPSDISAVLDRVYGYDLSISGIMREMDTGQVDVSEALAPEHRYSHPVLRLIDTLLLDAVKVGASDIHFEPEEIFVRLRYRIDGVMMHVHSFHKDYWPAILQRLKIMSDMNIADKFNPQDGRITLTFAGREIDFRVSAMPTIHGENIVLRVLDKSRALLGLHDLGFSRDNLDLLQRALKRPEGMIIVTGPTGSGKTTTLYAILQFINSAEANIMTLEDPVEYLLPMVRQSQVREGTRVTFQDGVRAILRQDPDIVLIGEVRDGDTAQMALRAAMTGHQVFTTLHTNDALAAVPRLMDLGLKPGLLAGNVIATMAQRLVRKLCERCKQPRAAMAEECRILGVDPENPPQLYGPGGCSACRNTGYAGRSAITEIVPVDDDLEEIIATGGSRAALKACAKEKGIKTLAEDGIGKVLDGQIDMTSLIRAVDLSSRL